jgi:hypothetical protein
MLLAPLHTEFGEFHLVFEETETANKYWIKTYEKFAGAYSCHLPGTRVVTFTSHDARYAVPNPHLLALHAAIGNILSASGRGERIKKLVRNPGSGGSGLASDDSTNTPICLLSASCHDLPGHYISRIGRASALQSASHLQPRKLSAGR